jgi:glycosidase
MQWTGGKNAGFSSAEPWFFVNSNYPEINAELRRTTPIPC